VRGILQPLIVRPHPTKTGFELVAGERRYRAAKLAKLELVPVIVQQLDAVGRTRAQLAENIQREDLCLADEAALLNRMHKEIKSVSGLAELVNKSVPWVSKRLSLAHGLGSFAAKLLADGITEDKHAVVAAQILTEKIHQ